MATISHFPQNLIDEHMAWHMNPIGSPGARSATDQGVDFLQFHHQFLQKVFNWMSTQPADFQAQYDLSPWTTIPMELKLDVNTGWNSSYQQQEDRITLLTPPFADLNDFGSYIENGIHNNYLHGACAVHYNDPNIGSPMTAPVISTWFYKIHGLINIWWAKYTAHTHFHLVNERFVSAVRVLFGVINDAPGVVIGADGKPHPVDPWPAILRNSLPLEAKKTVIEMAVKHLSEALESRHALENLKHVTSAFVALKGVKTRALEHEIH